MEESQKQLLSSFWIYVLYEQASEYVWKTELFSYLKSCVLSIYKS